MSSDREPVEFLSFELLLPLSASTLLFSASRDFIAADVFFAATHCVSHTCTDRCIGTNVQHIVCHITVKKEEKGDVLCKNEDLGIDNAHFL